MLRFITFNCIDCVKLGDPFFFTTVMTILYEGTKLTIEVTKDALQSKHEISSQVNNTACLTQLWKLTQRLADTGRLSSPDQFRHEGEQIYAIKARCGLRAYGWYHSQRRNVFVISHYILKKKEKLDPRDKQRAIKNRLTYEL